MRTEVLKFMQPVICSFPWILDTLRFFDSDKDRGRLLLQVAVFFELNLVRFTRLYEEH